MNENDLRNRFRRDFTQETIGRHQVRKEARATKFSPPQPKENQSETFTTRDPESTIASTPRLSISKNLLKTILLVLILSATILVTLSIIFKNHKSQVNIQSPSPVPVSISKSVNFPVYYPDQTKLPAGYTLSTNSFKLPIKNGVAYWINYDKAKRIVFSVQAKPSDNELQTFNSSYIPLHTDYQTAIGQAEIGAYHNETLVSLPVINGPWIVITAPPDINQDQLKQVLNALKH